MDAIVIGGGVAGLTCAYQLCREGVVCQVLEAADNVGGRIRTDHLDGFLLDRGFQVLLTAYPECQSLLDYEALDLCRFEPGALIWMNGKCERLVDPWRRPRHFLATALSPVATLVDKLRVSGFRRHTTRPSLNGLYHHREETTLELLRDRGFSDVIIERFFRPFLGGVFLDRQLETSSRLCEFVFRMFSLGDAAVPRRGMEEIPRQLAARIPAGVIRTNCPVAGIDGQQVILESGERITAEAVVVATAAPAARRLLNDSFPAAGRQVKCLYFAADQPPVEEPILVLNGDPDGPINNLCVPSQVSPDYAPHGKALISVTVVDDPSSSADDLQQRVAHQLESWYGPIVRSWQHLRTYEIPYALPVQSPPALEPVAKETRIRPGLYICGDHCDTASINGAMAAGRRAAEHLTRQS